jgi:hypothetical protein
MKQLSEIRQEISHLMRRTEDIRQEKMSAYKQGLIYTAIPAVAAIACLVMAGVGGMGYLIGAIIFAILIFVVYWFVASKHLRDFKNEFKSTVLEQFVQLMYPEVNYQGNGYISQSEFNQSQLFSKWANRYKGEDYFQGYVAGAAFQMSELNVQHRSRSHSSNGGSRSSTSTIFDGFFVVMELEQSNYAETYILPDVAENVFGGLGKMLQKSIGSFFSKGQMVYLDEHPEFEKQFAVYSTDEALALKLLKPPLLEAIGELRNKWNARPRVSFIGNKVYVAIQTRRNLFKINPRKNLVEEQQEIIEELYDEVALCIGIVETIANAY